MKKSEKIIRYISLLVGLSLFVFLILNFGIDNIFKNIAKSGWMLIPVIAVWGVVYLLNTISIYIIFGGARKKIGFLQTFAITLSGNAISLVTPFANMGGEPYRVAEFSRFIDPKSALSKVVLYKMIQWLSHFLTWITAIVLIFITMRLPEGYESGLLIILIALTSLVIFFFLKQKNGFFESLYNLLLKIKFLKSLNKKLLDKRNSFIELDDCIKELYNDRKQLFYLVLAIEYISRVFSSFEYMLILYGINIQISFLDAFYINAVMSFIMNMVFFIPSAIGVREGGLYLLMKSMVFKSGIGIYVSIVNRIREFFWVLTGLLLTALNTRMKRKKELANPIPVKGKYESSNL